MATNDIVALDEAQFGSIGSHQYIVAANLSGQGTGTTYVPSFRPGEPVRATLGGTTASTLGTIGTGTSSCPAVGTDYLYGVSDGGQGGTSTETNSAAGYVYVKPLVPGVIYLGNADTATSWDTQAEYNALLGKRVLIAMSSAVPPVYTILASDSANNGLTVEYIDVTKYPGKVAFALRQALSYNQ